MTQEIDDIIRPAELNDLPYILDLSKKESKCIGFIPKMAYESAITGIKKGDRWSDKCNDKMFVIVASGDLVGFCLASFGIHNSTRRTGKIAQICLQTDARLFLRGRILLDAVVNYGASLYVNAWQCGCADDLESNLFWRAMGWSLVAHRQGISHKNTWKQSSKRKVNLYKYDQSDMFLIAL